MGITGIIAFGMTCFYQFWRYNAGRSGNVWYDFVGIFIISICLFELLSRLEINLNKHIEKIIIYLSKASLGIFFIHILVQDTLRKFISFESINNSVAVLILTMLELIISISIIAVIGKNKFIKNKMLLIK